MKKEKRNGRMVARNKKTSSPKNSNPQAIPGRDALNTAQDSINSLLDSLNSDNLLPKEITSDLKFIIDDYLAASSAGEKEWEFCSSDYIRVDDDDLYY